VRTLAWGEDDNFITSGGADGAIYEWSLKDFRRCRENVIKVYLRPPPPPIFVPRFPSP